MFRRFAAKDTSGKRRLYTCGPYMRTVGAECEHNQVDAEALLAMTLCALSRYIPSSDASWKRVEKLLRERARSGEVSPVSRMVLNRQDIQLRRERIAGEHEICGIRMTIEKDENRYNFIATEFDRLTAELAKVDHELAMLSPMQEISASPDDDVAAALRLLTELRRVIDGPAGRPLLPTMLKHLGVQVGLNFRGMAKGPKREVRRLAGGLVTFGGFELPVPLHGRDRVASVECDSCSVNAVKSGQDASIDADTAQRGQESPLEGGDPPNEGTPGPTSSHQERISFTKDSRGDMI